MSGEQNTNFKAMSVAAIKKYLQERGVSVNGYLKPGLVELAVAVEKMMLPLDPNFERVNDAHTMKQRLNIHDIPIDDPFTMKTINDFIDSPPFGLYDIFNHLIYHSTDYDKQGLAAYKSFEDYRLFQDGYVRSLKTLTLKEAGVHVYIGQVQPTMRAKTDDGKNCYSLWFILEGRGANRGSVLDAFCKCKGGRDGGCKHISAAMYSLEELLNPDGDKSVTSGPCLWTPKPQSSSEPCSVDQLLIAKSKPPSNKKRKRAYTWLQNIDFDPRNPKHRKVSTIKERRLLTKRLSAVEDSKSNIECDSPSPGKPVILPLLRKLYLKKHDSHIVTNNGKGNHRNNNSTGLSCGQSLGILGQKVETYIQKTTEHCPEQFLKDLRFSNEEIEHVEEVTRDQWQCDDWYMHKVGFITASKCKDVCSRQTTLEKNNDVTVTALAKKIATEQITKVRAVADNPQNPCDWGLKHEDSARNSYLCVQKHLHYKVKLVKRGFLISKAKPFMGASVDNIRSCECACKCKDVLVEYKCPWVHRDLDPKEAFLTKEIGGIKLGKKDCLKVTTKYYYQVQMALFVTGLQSCDFVVWTRKGIHCVEIMVDESFMAHMLLKLEKFWVSQVVPLLFNGKETVKEKDSTQCTEPGKGKESNSFLNAKDLKKTGDLVCSNKGKESSPVIDIIDLDKRADCKNDTPRYIANGIGINDHDIATLDAGAMMNDNIVTVLLREHLCPFPVIEYLFYSILVGEQEGTIITKWEEKLRGASTYFTPEQYQHDFVVIPIVRRFHWLLMIITPWHILVLDSLTHDLSTRTEEVSLVTRYLDHMCYINNIEKKHTNLQPAILKVPLQQPGSNDCGIFITLFLKHFFEDLDIYEANPTSYIETHHQWFTSSVAQEKRTNEKRRWKILYDMHRIKHS